MTSAGAHRPCIIHSLVSRNVLTASEGFCTSPRAQAGHEAGVAMDFCKLCTLILRENAATELPPEPGLWNSLALAEFTQNTQGVCWGGVLHSLLSGNLFSAGKDYWLWWFAHRREGMEPEEI